MEIGIAFIFPLTPVLVAVAILFFALCGKIALLTPLLTTLSWITIIIISILMLIYNFKRTATKEDKLLGSVYMIISNVLSLKSSYWFLTGLNETAHKKGGAGVFEYAFVLFFGGALWLFIVAESTYSNSLVLRENNRASGYISAAVRLTIAFVVAGVFGFLG